MFTTIKSKLFFFTNNDFIKETPIVLNDHYQNMKKLLGGKVSAMQKNIAQQEVSVNSISN
jgi:hypothetical protein